MELPDTVSRHIGVRIERDARDVYAYASDPVRLPEWAPGLAETVEHVGGQWIVHGPMGKAVVAFAPPNAFGVLDHDVTLPSGETFHNPLRVLPHGTACEVVFSLRRGPGVSDEEFERDADAVLADLRTLKRLLEK